MIEFDAITTLCLACVLYLIGQTIINHVSILRRICIPALSLVVFYLQY